MTENKNYQFYTMYINTVNSSEKIVHNYLLYNNAVNDAYLLKTMYDVINIDITDSLTGEILFTLVSDYLKE